MWGRGVVEKETIHSLFFILRLGPCCLSWPFTNQTQRARLGRRPEHTTLYLLLLQAAFKKRIAERLAGFFLPPTAAAAESTSKHVCRSLFHSCSTHDGINQFRQPLPLSLSLFLPLYARPRGDLSPPLSLMQLHSWFTPTNQLTMSACERKAEKKPKVQGIAWLFFSDAEKR